MNLSSWWSGRGRETSRVKRRSLRGIDALERRELLSVSPLGPEFRGNASTTYPISVTTLTDNPFFFQDTVSNRSIAVDHDGDFVITWTAYSNGVTDPDNDGSAVFMRLFDRFGTPLTGDVLVNTFQEGNQRAANVAMDADGDFVIVWESEGQDPNDGSSGIYGQRFDARGNKLGAEFRVHTTTPNDQVNPSVAMDYDGNFIVTWETRGQVGSFFNDIRAQRFNFLAERVGPEFRVNEEQLPSFVEASPKVAADADGDFVIVWVGADPSRPDGVCILARGYTRDGVARGEQFTVNRGAVPVTFQVDNDGGHQPLLYDNAFIQINPQVAMDADGNWTAIWQSFQDNDVVTDNDVPESFGIYHRRFRPVRDGEGLGEGNSGFINNIDALGFVNTDLQDNTVATVDPDNDQDPDPGSAPFFNGNQVNPSVGLDADGDLFTVWSGNGAESWFFGSNADSSGVWLNSYSPDGGLDVRFVYPDGSFQDQARQTGQKSSLNQERVNSFTAGVQASPTIAVEPDGDYVVAWVGNGPQGVGIYIRRFNETTDTAGPLATDLTRVAPVANDPLPNDPKNDRGRIAPGQQIVVTTPLDKVFVTFNEQLSNQGGATGVNSVLNPNNWVLLRNGAPITGGVKSVAFSFNNAINKWEAEITVDGNGALPGTPGLDTGVYEIRARNSIRDVAGNPLGQTGAQPNLNGVAFSRTFSILNLGTPTPGAPEKLANTTLPGDQTTSESNQPVAIDASGNFVIVWTGPAADGTTDVFARLFRADGTPRGDEFRVNPESGFQESNPVVAMDADGDFVIVWEQGNPLAAYPGEFEYDIHALRFNAEGVASTDGEFRVNTFTDYNQRFPTVAMDVDGDFVVAWQSYLQDESGYGIYAQRFDSRGGRLGGVDEVQTLRLQGSPTGGTLSFTFNGKFLGTLNYTTANAGANMAAAIEALLRGSGITATVRPISTRQFRIEFGGRDGSRDLPTLEVNASGLTGSGALGATVDTTLDGVNSEFLVNDTTLNSQVWPHVDMDATGDFVITWTSFGQSRDGDSEFTSNIYAKRFGSNETIEGITQPDNPGPGLFFNLNEFGGDPTKWGGGQLGTGATVTYAFMRSGVDLGGGVNNTAINTFMPPGAEDEIRRAFEAWARVANLTFIEVLDTGEARGQLGAADIRIGGRNIDGAANILAQAFSPPPVGTTADQFVNGGTFGDIDFDTSEIWAINPDPLGFAIDIFLVAAHEIGHALGLAHTDPATAIGLAQLMAPDYNPLLNGPQFGDIFGVQFIYGVPVSGALSNEILVNTTTAQSQFRSTVALDMDGDFVIAWTSYGNDGGGNGYGPGQGGQNGVFARRFSALGQPLSAEFRVNTYSDGNQQFPRISMDADGDFVIIWESFQDDVNGDLQPDSYGVYAQAYVSSARLNDPLAGVDGRLGGEFRVNFTQTGDQLAPGVALTLSGAAVYTWSGPGTQILSGGGTISDFDGVIYLISGGSTTDRTGPIVTDVRALNGEIQQVTPGKTIEVAVTEMWVDFNENLSTAGGTSGANSVTNRNNWRLTRDGVQVDVITSIVWVADAVTNTYRARVLIDTDPTLAGQQPLEDGTYVLTISANLRDLANNALDGNYDGTPGVSFTRQFFVTVVGGVGGGGSPAGDDFLVNSATAGIQSDSQVASDSQGNFVVVWFDQAIVGTSEGILAQLFNNRGVPIGGPFTVNSFTPGLQNQPDVAMDEDGDFVVVWAGAGNPNDDDLGIFGQRFDRAGRPVGSQFLVNQTKTGVQANPSVGMDSEGNFVVTWNSSDGDRQGVFARRFSSSGAALGGEFRVNQHTQWDQTNADVAVDSEGDFVVTWQSYGQDGASWGIYARRYAATGAPLGNEFLVNTKTADEQTNPVVSISASGDFVIAWREHCFEPNLDPFASVFFRVYSENGTPLTGQVYANQTLAGRQVQPAVASDDFGNFVISWTTDNQDAAQRAIFARAFDRTGAPLSNEFLVNRTTQLGDQFESAITLDSDGDFVITWTHNDGSATATDIRGQRFNRFTTATQTGVGGGGSGGGGSGGGGSGGGGSGGGGSGGNQPSPSILGTAGNDVIEFFAPSGSTPASYILNGVRHTFAAGVTTFTFDGLGGNDEVIVQGTSGADVATLSMGNGRVTGAGYSFTVTNSEILRVRGNGGDDTGTITDSAGDDRLELGIVETRLFNAAGQNAFLYGFKRITVTATGGHDTAVIFDTAGDDTLELRPGVARFSNTGIDLVAIGFVEVEGRSNVGGNDRALLYDGAGDDTLDARPTTVTYAGPGFSYKVNSFETVRAYSSGGFDRAYLYDSAGDDDVYAEPAVVRLVGAGFANYAHGFDRVRAFAGNGFDRAFVYDSAADDDLYLYANRTEIKGATFENIVYNFDRVRAFASGGFDRAFLYDDPAADNDLYLYANRTELKGATFDNIVYNFDRVRAFASGGFDRAFLYDDPAADNDLYFYPDRTELKGATFDNIVYGFDRVRAFASGGFDRAYLYDSSGDDDLYLYADRTELKGANFDNIVYNFDRVRAFAGQGFDRAYLYDSAGDDSLYLYPARTELKGATFDNIVYNFDRVRAFAGQGTDQAFLYDSAGDDEVRFCPTRTEVVGPGYNNIVYNFDKVTAHATAGGFDRAWFYDSAGDDTLEASPTQTRLYGAGFDNIAKGFKETRTYATAGGYDTAILHDSSSDDVLTAETDWASVTSDLMAYWAQGFDWVKAMATAGGNNQKNVNGPLDFVLEEVGDWL